MLFLSMFISHIPSSNVLNVVFQKPLSTVSIKSVNAMPLWDFLPSNFEVVSKIMTIAELFIAMTTCQVS